MSAAAASSTCAAICRPFSMTFSPASTIALPLVIIDFEPPVPPPAISCVAVALQQADAPERDAEPRRQHLGERRGSAPGRNRACR